MPSSSTLETGNRSFKMFGYCYFIERKCQEQDGPKDQGDQEEEVQGEVSFPETHCTSCYNNCLRLRVENPRGPH